MILLALGVATGRGTRELRSSSAVLCPAAAHGGSFLGLIADEVFTVRAPLDGSPERWEVVDESELRAGGKASKVVANSFCGVYAQVLPDDGDDYKNVYGASSFVWTALEFRLRVPAEDTYTLFARWSGGDTVGGGDSFYVLVEDEHGDIVEGLPTWKETKVPIGETPGAFSGCCYDTTTHACPCSTSSVADGKAECNSTAGYWIDTAKATQWGATCVAGEGQLEPSAPLWYEFAGQEYGDVMDFDSEPWDATCEAQGTGTADSGRDEATWNLKKGEYVLKFYPREDGTAIDAIYVAPFGANPPNGLVLTKGQSSTCDDPSSSSSSSGSSSRVVWVWVVVAIVFIVVVVLTIAAANSKVRARITADLMALRGSRADVPMSPTYVEMDAREEAFIGDSDSGNAALA